MDWNCGIKTLGGSRLAKKMTLPFRISSYNGLEIATGGSANSRPKWTKLDPGVCTDAAARFDSRPWARSSPCLAQGWNGWAPYSWSLRWSFHPFAHQRNWCWILLIHMYIYIQIHAYFLRVITNLDYIYYTVTSLLSNMTDDTDASYPNHSQFIGNISKRQLNWLRKTSPRIGGLDAYCPWKLLFGSPGLSQTQLMPITTDDRKLTDSILDLLIEVDSYRNIGQSF